MSQHLRTPTSEPDTRSPLFPASVQSSLVLPPAHPALCSDVLFNFHVCIMFTAYNLSTLTRMASPYKSQVSSIVTSTGTGTGMEGDTQYTWGGNTQCTWEGVTELGPVRMRGGGDGDCTSSWSSSFSSLPPFSPDPDPFPETAGEVTVSLSTWHLPGRACLDSGKFSCLGPG